MKKNTMKKVGSLLIAGIMTLSLLPLTSLAEGEAPAAPAVVAPAARGDGAEPAAPVV